MTDMTVANTIAEQLGRQALYMMGAKNLVGSEDALSFHVSSGKYNGIRITLNANDLYDISYLKIRKYQIVKEVVDENVYAEDMRKFIEKQTGLYLSL